MIALPRNQIVEIEFQHHHLDRRHENLTLGLLVRLRTRPKRAL